MTMEQTVQVLTLVQCEYPGSFSQLDERGMALKIELWAKEFANDEYNIVFAAVRTYMRTPERFAPSIGQVREIMTSLTAGEELPEQSAWALVSAACRNGLYGYREEFDKLPPEVQAAVGAPEQLKAWAAMDADTVESVVASNFMRNFKANKAREKARAALPPEMRDLIAGISDHLKLGGGESKNALPEGKRTALLPPVLEPMKYVSPEPKAPPVQNRREYTPLPEGEWVKRREELLRTLEAERGAETCGK